MLVELNAGYGCRGLYNNTWSHPPVHFLSRGTAHPIVCQGPVRIGGQMTKMESQDMFQVQVGFSARKSWADEEEELRELEKLECDLLVSRNGEYERVTRDDLIEHHQKFYAQSLYQIWARGKDADLAERIFQPLYYVNRVFNESMEDFDRKADRIAADMRNKVFRVCKTDDSQCFATFKVHEKAMLSFCVEFQKICNTAMKMYMFPKEDPTPMMESLTNICKWQLMHRFRGLCTNPKRTKEAEKLRNACYDAAHEFYMNTAGALMLAEKQVVKTHRELIKYKIKFDQMNPDVVALMKE